MKLRKREVLSKLCQAAAPILMAAAIAQSAYACGGPSYYNDISNDDMYVYGITQIQDLGNNVSARVFLDSPDYRYSNVNGAAAWDHASASTQLGIAGVGGDYVNYGITEDSAYGELDPDPYYFAVTGPYVQVTGNAMDNLILSIGGTPSCGTDTASVFTFRAGLAYPTVTVNFAQVGGTGTLTMPSDRMQTVSATNTNVAALGGVCASSVGSGMMVRATIATVSGSYSITPPSPASNQDTASITVGP